MTTTVTDIKILKSICSKNVLNHLKYARKRYPSWFTQFVSVAGIISLIQPEFYQAVGIILICFIAPFLFPFAWSFIKNDFSISTIGKSEVKLTFGNLFHENYIVITTTRYYDINPTGNYIAESSVIGKFVREFLKDEANILEVEKSLKSHLKHQNGKVVPAEYGDCIVENIGGKKVYFLVFTDREKQMQPQDFYVKTMQRFLDRISAENHGEYICVPLLGDNNNLSDTGFPNSVVTLQSFITMVNYYEIVNQRSTVKLKIVVLPEKRSELIGVLD